MSTNARVNNEYGGDVPTQTVTLATGSNVLQIPANAAVIELAGSGTPTIATFSVPSYSRGRRITLINASAVNIVVTTNNATTTAGQFDLGAADVTLAPADTLVFYIRNNGTGLLISKFSEATMARVDNAYGGGMAVQTVTLATGAQALTIPTNASVIELGGTGSPSLSTFTPSDAFLGRTITLINASAVNIVVTNNAGTTTAGQFDVGATDLTLGPTDVLTFYVRSNGTGLRLSSADN